ncbi:MAG: hypothetical protein A3D67_01075 [Candidatus Lloydbacteria bacterium RIFCSPHIGHO2_02_FULL_51_22]|uniref:Uncharacterized protein n=3 Tax=Candidatus Lloydiibacteriota TaxID=1817910 RepID=A0A1G2DBW1_9BACT|nr:MAG: hypothetical protein A3D67_01075 [Candidatus Lloydbacteria bacterium RIFCSPHIGHO2_02_FULL_51_22]OGZ15057.1 MAG: hypothetical protein A3J08_01795 [Candidatus Lloydbacteria bacterium RIFCSPLOWO2_02_FULL_51_11]OGZ16932.1 MAG: hypothetical protein A3G11_00790 [Candidatus Lloydbacteria bacterium RIFCSPLOWO2_12_FULL_51_9]
MSYIGKKEKQKFTQKMKSFFIQHTTYGIRYTKYGFGLIEIVIASAIIGTALASLSGVLISAFRMSVADASRAQATFLAEEGVEAVRLSRDTGWQANIAPLLVGTLYYPVFDTEAGAWTLETENPGLIDETFSRTIVVGDVFRRESDDAIAPDGEPGATFLDEGTLRATSLVGWQTSSSTEKVELMTFVADIYAN